MVLVNVFAVSAIRARVVIDPSNMCMNIRSLGTEL